jgi:E3 ubiquitin-protein ligase SIAH1
MERVVDSVRGPCSNAPYGCDATPAYHGRDKHLLACPHAPCHCPAGVSCGFAGSTVALLDHIKAAHG